MTIGPLVGRRVLLPRPQGRGAGLIRALADAGAEAHTVPLIEIQPPGDPSGLDAAVMALSAGGYDWVVFTSVNAVSAVLNRAAHLELSPAVPADTQVAAVGPATAAALRAAGLPVDLMPDRAGSGAALAGIFPAPRPGQTVLCPASEIAGDTVAVSLSGQGYRVESVAAYRTVVLPVPDPVAGDLAAGAYQAIVLTSPSTARALSSVSVPSSTVIIALGRPTAAAAAEAGLTISAVAENPTDEAVIAALVEAALPSGAAGPPDRAVKGPAADRPVPPAPDSK